MATMRAYTTIKQSRKLAEILPLESADSCWTNHLFDFFLSSWRIESTSPKEYKSLLDTFNVKGYLIEPAWSLAALLDVLESEIYSEDGKTYQLNIVKGGTWWYIEYIDQYGEANLIETKSTEVIDACYEMILKLKELNLL